MERFWPKRFCLHTICFALLGLLTVSAHTEEQYFFHGDRGYSTTFNLIGGQYTLYVHAQFVQNYKTHSPDSCIFIGNLQRVSPNPESSHLGGPVPVRNAFPFKLGPMPVNLTAGHYAFYVASSSDCEWKLILVSAAKNTTGVAGLQMFTPAPTGTRASKTASLKDPVQFTAQYRVDNNAAVPISGEMQILHDGKVVETYPVKFGIDKAMQASIAYVPVHWNANDAKYVGTNTAKMLLKIGGKDFTTSLDFKLAP